MTRTWEKRNTGRREHCAAKMSLIAWTTLWAVFKVRGFVDACNYANCVVKSCELNLKLQCRKKCWFSTQFGSHIAPCCEGRVVKWCAEGKRMLTVLEAFMCMKNSWECKNRFSWQLRSGALPLIFYSRVKLSKSLEKPLFWLLENDRVSGEKGTHGRISWNVPRRRTMGGN